MRELRGRVAVVTGGASGIGWGICRTLAREGMQVVVADVDLPAAEKACAELRERGVRALAVHTDVSKRASVESLLERTLRELGGVHLVCNNAGVYTGGDPLADTEGDWRWLVGVNLMGVVHGCQVFAPQLVAQGEGHIVNTASVGAFLAAPELAIYSATKFAVLGFSEALRAHLAPKGVGVSILCPGAIRTNLARSDRLRPPEAGPAGGSSQRLAHRLEAGADPLEVGEHVLRGVREDAEYVFTHGEFRALVEARFQRVLAALPVRS
jgi:NAD(P)-dependent dehydrogenase (short-subunit alcohol dehydrogenase family)